MEWRETWNLQCVVAPKRGEAMSDLREFKYTRISTMLRGFPASFFSARRTAKNGVGGVDALLRLMAGMLGWRLGRANDNSRRVMLFRRCEEVFWDSKDGGWLGVQKGWGKVEFRSWWLG